MICLGLFICVVEMVTSNIFETKIVLTSGNFAKLNIFRYA